MSVFAKLRRSRQAAKEHQAKAAEQKKKEETKEPYRHVPTHAATDAISGAPPTWRADDRTRILENNRRRSAMSAIGMGMPGPAGSVGHGGHHHPTGAGIPRATSSLSHVSYPSVYANPVVNMPRSYSYSGGLHAAAGSSSASAMYQQPWAGRQSVVYVPVPVDQNGAPISPTSLSFDPRFPSSSKGKEVERIHAYDAGMTSLASSKRV